MFAEDLTQFFNADEFADEASLSGVDVVGIFDKAYVVTEAGMGMATTRPAFILPASDVPAAPVSQLLVLAGVTYAIAGIDPEGSDRNVTVLLLEKTV
jgi:hypothetical protein